MSADVTKKRNTGKAFADEENHADEPRKRPTTMNQSRSLIQQLPSSSIHPPERPESVLPSLAIQHDDLEDVQELELYTYKPLVLDNIRLLLLYAGHGDDPIHCSLVNDSISAPSSYEALSYTWGEPHPEQRVLLSDEEPSGSFTTPRPSVVTPSLYDALSNIRRSDRPLVLWVDALCIDQKNTAEKSHQVGLMTKIYSNAHRVLVWLGNEDSSTAWAVSNVQSVLSLDASCSTTPNASCKTRSTAVSLYMAWNHYLHSPWFKRMWVLQELAFARRATFIRGESELDSQDVQMVVDVLLQHLSSHQELELGLARSNSPSKELGFEPLRVASNFFNLIGDSIERSADGLEIILKKRRLFDLIRQTSSLRATDPRDRVYALLAIANQDYVSCPIIADYNLSLTQVRARVVKCQIEASQSLDILTIPWRQYEAKDGSSILKYGGSDGTPSWVCSALDRPLGFTQRLIQHPRSPSSKALRRLGPGFTGLPKPFTASKNYLPNAYFGPYERLLPLFSLTRFSLGKHPHKRSDPAGNAESILKLRVISKSALVASGIEVGTITDVSMRMAGGIVSRDCLEMAGISFSEGCEALQNKPHKVWEQLWRILVADRNNEGLGAPKSFGLAFLKLFKGVLRLRCIDTEEMLKTITDHDALEFLSRVRDVIMDRRMFNSIGVNHYGETLIGLVPGDAQVGDQIIILFGSSVPIVVRPAKDNYTTIVGEAYVHGKMHGEAFYGLSAVALLERTRRFQII